MALQADLKTMRIEELLQWIQSAAVSGRLSFRHMSGDVEMLLSGGSVVHVASPLHDAWAAAQVGDEAWRKARDWAQRDRTTPVEILARVGLMAADRIGDWIDEAGRRAVHQLLLSDHGYFVFEESDIRGRGVPVERLLLEVAREVDERQAVQDRFGSALVWLEAVPRADLTGVPPALAAALREGIHLIETAWLLPDDAWETAKVIHQLVVAGKVLAMPVEAETPGDPIKAYQEAVICERSFRYEAAAALFETAIAAAWGDAMGREAAARWCDRYLQVVDRNLIPAARLLARAADARPTPGDPYAAYVLRCLAAPQTMSELGAAMPFHKFFSVRSARRLAAAGQLAVRLGSPS